MNKNLIPRFFVVIHAQETKHNPNALDHVVKSAVIAFNNNADGVFLIPDYESGKRASSEDLFLYFDEIKKIFPKLPVGVNFLKYFEKMEDTLIARVAHKNFDMIQSYGSFTKALSFKDIKNTIFFMGLAFKYSRSEKATGDTLKKLCESIPVDENVIPTTSGPATGQAASLDKIIEIKKYLPNNKRLGIASGVTLNNVNSFLKTGITDFLVTSSLIKQNISSFDILDELLVQKMAEKIHK